LKNRGIIPGFGLSMGFTVFYLSFIVLIPLSALFIRSADLSWGGFWDAIASSRALASYRLTFGASLISALINSVFGLISAWVLTRYNFPGKKLADALIDLPFAIPTAVAGITLASLYSPNGWIGQIVDPLGIKIAYTPIGIIIAMTFIGMPFVVRTVQPVLEELDRDVEEAAASLGAGRFMTIRYVIFPAILPALITGFAMAFARAVGEYGSVIFIAGNMPMVSEITPLLIITKLEQYDYAGATAIGVSMLIVSFVMLLIINFLERWTRKNKRRKEKVKI
jgi:sulfate transport system permease protein